MDYFAHGFWIYILFHRTKKPLYAVLFGLLPDTLSWGIYLLYRSFIGLNLGKPDIALVPDWAFTLYGLTHSLVVFGIVLLLVYLIFRKIPIYIFAWPISIVIDTLTHTREFLPTPFLWPISDWKFPGISWGRLEFVIVNYILILGFLTYIIVWDIKRKKSKELS